MAWQKSGEGDLSGGASATLDVDVESKDFHNYMLYYDFNTTPNSYRLSFNGNTNTVYAYRLSRNGGGEVIVASVINHNINDTNISVPMFTVGYLIDISSEEKLTINFSCEQGTAGAGTAPDRVKFVGKFVPSPDADVTQYTMLKASGTMGTDTQCSVLGTD